jgi:hypothetical protein
VGFVRQLIHGIPRHRLRVEPNSAGVFEDVPGDVQRGIDVRLLGFAHAVDVLGDVVKICIGQLGAALFCGADHASVLAEDDDADRDQRNSRDQNPDDQEFRLQFDICQYHEIALSPKGIDPVGPSPEDRPRIRKWTTCS